MFRMADEIIQELRTIKDESAKEAGNDIDELCRRLREREKVTTAAVIDLSRKRRKPHGITQPGS
jgi:hypothetical protein